MYTDIDRTIEKYQKESEKQFRDVLEPKRFKNKRQESMVIELSGMLGTDPRDVKTIRKMVRRYSRIELMRAADWASLQPGKDKVRLFCSKLSEPRRTRQL